MNGLGDLLAGAQPVTAHEAGRVRLAARIHAAGHTWPRFFLSPSYLAAYGDAFIITVIDGCVVIAKRRQVMGNPAVYLIVPPQHIDCDPAAERRVIERFRALGAGTMLSSDDLVRYGYGRDEVGPAGLWGNEYVYDAATFAEPAGGTHRRTRAVLNQIHRSREIEVASWQPDEYEVVQLARTWQQQTGRHASEAKIAQQWYLGARNAAARRHCSALYLRGRLAAYSLTEEVAAGQVVIVARLRDYEAQIPDPTLALHALDAAHWRRGLLTIGAAGSASLAAHKQKLRPVKVLPVHKLHTAVKVTMDDYRATKPGQETLL